ncbi:DUF2004 domain-containing protein [Paenibacillus sp. DCT19]|uniref:DUF6985 domain-containing protein n=1 Tax=Paenibacillus sp. DCT19 TaxID=2211212 RepID=UPI000FE1A65E|nr:DUF2004 domain-containing protein [Paenibacillus sp. DCT19]
MIKNDPIFGELDYNFVWSRNIVLQFLGEEVEVSLLVDGEKDGRFDEKQYTSYQTLVQNWQLIQFDLMQPMLDYYKQKRHELGYDIIFNENYPNVETTEQLMKMVTLDSIVVPYGEINEERDIGILFNCTWDLENGVGLRLLDEKVVDMGYQDVAI